MDSVSLFLIAIAGIFLVGAIGEVMFQKTGIPDVIWLILVGILLGPVGGFVNRGDLAKIAPYFAAITLVVILFNGGIRLRLDEVGKAAPRSGFLAISTFLASVLIIALVSLLLSWAGVLPEVWGWRHGFLLGSILGGSSSIIIMPAMAKAGVRTDLSNLVGLESALTDALCVVGAVAFMNLIVTGQTDMGAPIWSLGKSFGIGLAVGSVSALVWFVVLNFLKSDEYSYPITLSALLILYVVIDSMGGSAALGILAFAIIVGNGATLAPKLGFHRPVQIGSAVGGFHQQISFFIKSIFFTFIGLMLGPPIHLMLIGALMGVCLFLARIPGVQLAMLGTGTDRKSLNLIIACLPRGMAAGVLATLPHYKGVAGTEGLPAIVFTAVFVTIVIFTFGFAKLKNPAPAAGNTGNTGTVY